MGWSGDADLTWWPWCRTGHGRPSRRVRDAVHFTSAVVTVSMPNVAIFLPSSPGLTRTLRVWDDSHRSEGKAVQGQAMRPDENQWVG